MQFDTVPTTKSFLRVDGHGHYVGYICLFNSILVGSMNRKSISSVVRNGQESDAQFNPDPTKGVFGLGHQVEYNGMVPHIAPILVFG